MSDVLTTDELLDMVVQSGLVAPSWLTDYRERLRNLGPAKSDPDAVARLLVKERILTPFQARQLLGRRFRGFFIGDKYKILLRLGQGGMGRVLLCEHLMLQRLVAVKLMNVSADTAPSAVDRFLREARATAAMDHPNIARVFDVDRCEQGPYMVMEYIDGINLHELVAQHGRLPIERAVDYVRQAATGLQHAHEAGLVHRDIKPSNLMLDRGGTIKLLDLGLARFFDAKKNDHLTQQADVKGVLGTTDFMAPEQALDSSTADIRADIYSLGCTFYFLLLRKLTVGNGSTIQKLLFHQSRDPEPILSIRPDVPEGLAAVVEKMIRKQPSDRYQTPAEVVDALLPWTLAGRVKPPAVEMPKVTPSDFRLGLCPPPQGSGSGAILAQGSGSGAPLAAPTSSARSAQVSTGTSSGVAARQQPAPSRESALASLLTEEGLGLAEPSNPPEGPASDVRLAGDSQVPAGREGALAVSKTTAGIPATKTLVRSTGTSAGAVPANKAAGLAAPGSRPPAGKPPGTRLPGGDPLGPAPSRPAPPAGLAATIAGLDRRSRLLLWLVGLLGGIVLVAVCGLMISHWAAARQRAEAELAQQQKAEQESQAAARRAAAAPALAPPRVVLRGGGSTFVKPIIEHWAQLYQKQTGIAIEYTAVGSSKGIDGVTSRFLDFGCSDAYMTDKQLADASRPLLHVPLIMGAVVPTYNVPDEKGQPLALRFTGPLLANIYLGNVKKWNDPAIAVNNPGQKLPDLDIVPVHRKEGSGTTSIWTDYLSKASATWKAQVGSGTKVEWSGGVAAEKNDGVADAVSRTPGAIGYVELSYALGNGLQVGEVRNRAGKFIAPSVDSITAAAAGALQDIPDDLRYSLTDAPGEGSYPIVGTAWAIIYVEQPTAKRKTLINFLRWATGEGQQFVADLKYGRLPPELVAKIHAELDQVGGGKL